MQYQKVAKMTKVAELGASDVKALMAALTFIVVNSAKYNILEETLRTELEQLGMPKGEHAFSLLTSRRQTLLPPSEKKKKKKKKKPLDRSSDHTDSTRTSFAPSLKTKHCSVCFSFLTDKKKNPRSRSRSKSRSD